uniref:thioredoxin family protein n=2 Tax=Thomasclavelia cocleata TaxID=69824 RepID=UPI00256F27DE
KGLIHMKKILVLLSLMLIIVGCQSKNSNKDINSNNKNELIEIDKKGDLEKITDGYIYFSSKECPLCLEVAPLVKEEIKVKEIDYNIYHFDISEMLEKDIYTSEELLKLCNTYYIQALPTILKLKNGNEVSRFPSDHSKELDELSKELKDFFEEK